MTPNSSKAEASPAPTIALKWRLLISVILAIHLTAVFIPPFTFATSTGPGLASPFAQPVMDTLRPYIDATFLNHGYFFFAPNPGPSHLIRYEVAFEGEQENEAYTMPDRKRHWPRLFYHRQFMLSETLNTVFVPSIPPPGMPVDSEEYRIWRYSRDYYDQMKDSFANKLKVQYDAASVSLTRVEHRQPSPAEFVEQRVRLDDPRLYRDLPDFPLMELNQ